MRGHEFRWVVSFRGIVRGCRAAQYQAQKVLAHAPGLRARLAGARRRVKSLETAARAAGAAQDVLSGPLTNSERPVVSRLYRCSGI